MDTQIVTGSSIVIMFEKALACIDEVVDRDKTVRYVFTAPIPTMCGLLCKDCLVCQICGTVTDEQVRVDGNIARVCLGCTDYCTECGQGKIKQHSCCAVIRH